MVALQQVGVKVDRYVAYEIDKYAIQIAKKNYPMIDEMGDITTADFTQYKGFDLVIFGSCCQSLSRQTTSSKEGYLGLDGKSKIFFDCVRAIKEAQPKYFFAENVAGMSKECKEIFTELLGVEPVQVNSQLVSAQYRERLYWTNIPIMPVFTDKNIMLRNICLDADKVEDKYWYNESRPFEYYGDKKVCGNMLGTGFTRQTREIYHLNHKCRTIGCDGGGGNRVAKLYQDGRVRKLTPLEYERLQTFPDNYTEGVADSHRYNAMGNSWTINVVKEWLKFFSLDA